MINLQIFLLGIVQGITEFLPVSSSAHLILISEFFGWHDQGINHDIAVHVGTLGAVIYYFRKEIIDLFKDFFSSIKSKKSKQNFLEELYLVIKQRANSRSKKSYTKELIKKGKKEIAQKIGEEASELIIDYINGSKKRTIEEASDLIYHLLVMLYTKNISINDIKKELEKRKHVRR